jgi:hypothetical protein
MAKKLRVQIPRPLADRALFEADRTCCVCRQPKKPLQIHHIDDNPSNNNYENLAVLCLDCHTDTQVHGGFNRKLSAGQVRLYREDWLRRIRNDREGPGSRSAASEPDAAVKTGLARLEVAITKQDWLTVARIYHAAGDIESRDRYIDRGLAEDPSPFYQVLFANLRGTAHQLPEAVKQAAAEQVERDWTTHGGILLDVGKTKDAALTWLAGVQEAVEDGRWFVAAYYIRHALNAQVFPAFIETALADFIEQDDLWWQLRCYEELGWTESAKELLLGNERRIVESGHLPFLQKLATAKGDAGEVLRITREVEEIGPAARFFITKSNEDVHEEDDGGLPPADGSGAA